MHFPFPTSVRRTVANLKRVVIPQTGVTPGRPPAKRPFRRRGGILVDSYDGGNGVPVEGEMPASMLGVVMPPKERASLIRSLGGRIRRLWGGSDENVVYALQNDTSEEYRQGLLRSLAAGDIAAPNALAQFPDDPRVRPALVEAALKASAVSLPNFAQALATVGGPGAVETLLKRFHEVRADRRVWDDDKFINRYAFTLTHLAKDILRLAPGYESAATALVELTMHPCRANRNSAFSSIVELMKKALPDRTAAILNQGIEGLMADTSPEVSTRVFPLLMRRSPEEAVRRLAGILASPDAMTRMMGLPDLLDADFSRRADVQELLLRHMEQEPSPQISLRIAQLLGNSLPRERRLVLIRKGLADESPTQRFWGIMYSTSVDAPEEISALVKEALADEPDPQLLKVLSTYLEFGGSGKDLIARFLVPAMQGQETAQPEMAVEG